MKIADGALIPRNLTSAQRAFSGIVGAIAPKTPTRERPVHSKRDSAQTEDDDVYDIGAPLWKDDDFQVMMDAMKNRTLTLDEFKRIAEEELAPNQEPGE